MNNESGGFAINKEGMLALKNMEAELGGKMEDIKKIAKKLEESFDQNKSGLVQEHISGYEKMIKEMEKYLEQGNSEVRQVRLKLLRTAKDYAKIIGSGADTDSPKAPPQKVRVRTR